MRYLRTNTATRVTVGPFLDKTDGITPETALTVTGCHLTLMCDVSGVPTLVLDANATASGGSNDMVHVTNDDAGFYDLELTAAQLNYIGRAILSINDVSTHCPVFHEYQILPAAVFDALFDGAATYLSHDKVLAYFQLALRTDAAVATDRATELSAINANQGSGAGGYDNTAAPTAVLTSGERVAVAAAIWRDTVAGDFTVAGSIGKSLAPATLGTSPGASGGHFIAGTNDHLTITNSVIYSSSFSVVGQVIFGDGIDISPGTVDRDAVRIVGNGAGDGIHISTGATGVAFNVEANPNCDAIVITTSGSGNAMIIDGPIDASNASNDIIGVKLHAAGLDAISTTAPTGVASNFRQMMVQLWRRFFKRSVRTSTQIKTYADNGTSVLTTQSYTSSSTDDDVGAAT